MVWATLISTIFSGITQSVKDYGSFKTQELAASREIKLAQIAAEKEQIASSNKAESDNLRVRLDSTSREFKQNTFWLLCVPVAFTILVPQKAEVMWHNFSLVPEYVQWLFLTVYSSIWGIPIVKGGYGAITDMVQSRREYKIERANPVNEAAYAAALRDKVYPQGMTQQQWENQQAALHAAIGK